MRLGWMGALYHWPTTETSLSSPFRGHARLSVIPQCAKDLSKERRMEDGRPLALTPRVRRGQATTQLFARRGPSDLFSIILRSHSISLRQPITALLRHCVLGQPGRGPPAVHIPNTDLNSPGDCFAWQAFGVLWFSDEIPTVPPPQS